MKARDYQHKAALAVIEQWREVRSTLVVAATGTGKTFLLADIIRRCFPKRALVLAHREELIFQAQDKIHRVTGYQVEVEMADLRASLTGLQGRTHVVVSSIQTQTAGGDGGGRMGKFDPKDFGLLIIDECFPAGTMIDGKPIETIGPGEKVTAFDHAKGCAVESTVGYVFKSYPQALCRVVLDDGREIICTPGHPFYSINKSCYIPAHTLSCFDMVLTTIERNIYVQENMQGVRKAIRSTVESENVFEGMRNESKATFSPADYYDELHGVREAGCLRWKAWARNGAKGAGILFKRMLKSVLCKDKLDRNGKDQSPLCVGTHDAKQPNETGRSTGQGIDIPARGGMDANGSPRKRMQYLSAKVACLRAWMGNGTGDPDKQNARLSELLQSGHRERSIEDSRGSGRKQPLRAIAQGGRCKENVRLGVARVARVEILQQGCEGTFGGLCPNGFVYNLEVERHHNYFANGVLVHNCHHSTAKTYRRVIDYYGQNQNLKILGVTATPDRADEEALGQIFQSVAFDYEVLDAIRDGWLVPVEQQVVEIDGLDFSSVRTTAGDLNGADLAAVMEAEKPLHGIADATLAIAGTRRCLVFAASVKQAEQLAEIFNRHRAGSAGWVCGKTPKEDRRRLLAEYAAGSLQFMVNVGVLTEGFDDPGVELVVMGRPTKSRALYAQMIGRATRPLAGVVDDADDSPEHRRAAIAASRKPTCLVVDFAGNAGRHKLMTSADILGGNVSDEAVELAATMARKAGKPMRMDETLAAAEEELKRREERRQADAARRARLVAKAQFSVQSVDPFNVLEITPQKARGWDAGKSLSEKQRNLIVKHYPGVNVDQLPFTQGKQLVQELFRRWDAKLCTFKQARILAKHGYDTKNMTMAEAGKILDGLFGNKRVTA